MATAAASDPSRNLIDLETADNPNSIAESGSNNNNASATDTVDTRNATGTLDEDTSSIEALNWCEFDEDEMASAKAPEIISSKPEVDEENMDTVEQEILSTGPPLSTSLLQSIDSQMSEDDKVTNIENWASEVISATTEEGLINDLETVIDDSGLVSTSTSSTTVYQRVPETEEKLETISKGSRKRPHKSNVMAMSTMSSLSSAESKGDPLSNAPVLDDGPIWGKGSKRYKFQENRRFNQKLTFGVLLSVVMAIGLGLGNLVAYNECEAEYKATPSPTTAPPVSSSSPDDNLKPGEEPSLKSVAPEDNANEDNVKQRDVSEDIKFPVVDEEIKASDGSTSPAPHDNNKHEATKNDEKKEDILSDKISKPINEKPFVDPTYASHAEALASVVKSLDQLSRKIDQFQNTTRQLGGIVMLKEEVMKELRSKTGSDNNKVKDDDNSQPIFEEEVHPDVADDEVDFTDLVEDKLVEDLIEAIDGHDEQMENDFEMGEDESIRSIDDDESKYMKELIDKYYFAPLKKMKEEFIEQERERILQERLKVEEEDPNDYERYMKIGEYNEEDKRALLARYREFQKQYEAQNKLDYSSSETEKPQKVQDTEEIVRVDSDEDTHVISEEMRNLQQIKELLEKVQVNDIKQEEKLTPPEDPIPLVNSIDEKDVKKSNKKLQEKERKEKPNQENLKSSDKKEKSKKPTPLVNNIDEKDVKKSNKKRQEKERKEKQNQENLKSSEKKEKSKKEFKNKDNKREHNKSEQPLAEKDSYKESNKHKRQEKQKRDSSQERDMKKKEERDNSSGNGKRKKRQEKRQKYIDERFYDESEINNDWANYENDWSDHRAKLREQNRNDVYSDSSSHLIKKNKNWQLDRDRAREKFRNKNKSDSD